MAFAASAATRTEGGKNLVKNGSFDAPGYEQATPSEWSWEPMNECQMLSVLPDWTIKGQDVWQGAAEIQTGDFLVGDGETRDEDDMTVLRFFTDTDNMWSAITLSQIVDGLVAGTEYNLNFAAMGQWVVFDDGTVTSPMWSVRVCEVDGDQAGKEIGKWDLGDLESSYFETKAYKFKSPSDKVFLEFSFGGWEDHLGSNAKHDLGWLCIDNVDLYDPNGESAVTEITIDENAPVEYFNLQGIRVAEPENGLYIRRQGEKTSKVIL